MFPSTVWSVTYVTNFPEGWTSCNHLFFFGCFTIRFSLSSFSEVKFVHGKIKIIGKAWWQIKTNEGFKMSSYTVLMHVFKYKKTGSEKSGSGCFRSQLITHNFWRHLINYKIAGDQFIQAVSCFCEETNDIPMSLPSWWIRRNLQPGEWLPIWSSDLWMINI